MTEKIDKKLWQKIGTEKHDRNAGQKSMTEKVNEKCDRKAWQKNMTEIHDRKTWHWHMLFSLSLYFVTQTGIPEKHDRKHDRKIWLKNMTLSLSLFCLAFLSKSSWDMDPFSLKKMDPHHWRKKKLFWIYDKDEAPYDMDESLPWLCLLWKYDMDEASTPLPTPIMNIWSGWSPTPWLRLFWIYDFEKYLDSFHAYFNVLAVF